MSEIPTVVKSTEKLGKQGKHVTINSNRLEVLAKKFSQSMPVAPQYREQPFLISGDHEVVDYFILGNALNYGGLIVWEPLAKAVNEGIPILEGSTLKHMDEAIFARVFGNQPLVKDISKRIHIMRDIGDVLVDQYGGFFHDLPVVSGHRLYNSGVGFIERLAGDFISFDDSYAGARFDKKAMQAASMLFGRFGNNGAFHIKDPENLAIPTGYAMPRIMRELGILEYSPALAKAIASKKELLHCSDEVLEIRATTIQAGQQMLDMTNSVQNQKHFYAPHLETFLRCEIAGQVLKNPAHRTRTSAY